MRNDGQIALMTSGHQTIRSRGQISQRSATLLMCVFSLFFMGFVGTQAAASDVFNVNNVTVDVKADTAAIARTQALAEAERKAFYILIRRLTLTIDEERIPELSPQEITAYVRDFSVAEEKTSSVRYIARLNYRFKPDEIRALLRAYDVPFAETPSRPAVVIAVYEIGATTELWGEPNPWRDSWATLDSRNGLVPIVVPLGDLTDISSISASEAMAGDLIRLEAIATRYNAASAIVAHNNITLNPTTGGQLATVTLIRPEDPIPLEVKTVSYDQRPGEELIVFMDRVARSTHQRIENLWIEQNLISQDEAGVVSITVPITGLKDWLAVKKQLARVGIIRQTEVVLISRDQVRLNLFYVGGLQQLNTALEQNNLSMLQEAGDWIVMPIGVFQPPKI
jgi:hypothetical protein